MKEMLFRKARFSPSMAVPMSVTVTMPITIPKVVRVERSLLARIAPHEMLIPSLSSVRKFIRGLPPIELTNARKKRQRTAALQDLAEGAARTMARQRLGVRL